MWGRQLLHLLVIFIIGFPISLFAAAELKILEYTTTNHPDNPCKTFGGYSCNCKDTFVYLHKDGYFMVYKNKNHVSTGYKGYGGYPKIGECLKEGIWQTSDSTCFPDQPATLPPNTLGKRAVAGMCWELWCQAGTYFVARMTADGGREGKPIFGDGCKECPAGEELVPDFSDPSKIVYAVLPRKKQ